jgi:hypothetical protein
VTGINFAAADYGYPTVYLGSQGWFFGQIAPTEFTGKTD